LGLIIVVIGLALSAYGAVLLLAGSGGTGPGAARANWRSRRTLAVLGLGAALVVLGALILLLRNVTGGVGQTGVVLVVLLELAALLLDAIGIVALFLSGVALAGPEDLDAQWLDRAQHLTRIGLGFLFGGLVAQLAAIAIIAL
jgi:hypothetical protein